LLASAGWRMPMYVTSRSSILQRTITHHVIRIEWQKTKRECRIRFLSVPIKIKEKYRQERTDDKVFKLKTLKNITQKWVLKED